MSIMENQTVMIQMDAFKTEKELSEEKIYNKIKSHFNQRVNHLFGRADRTDNKLKEFEDKLERLKLDMQNLSYKMTILFDELEASRHIFMDTYSKVAEFEKKVG